MTLDIQFLSMLASAGTGIVLGASFDTYRRFLRSPKRFRWSLIVNDILFWVLQALLFFYVLLQVNHGEVRFYLLIALVLGYSIYRSLFEGIYQKMLEGVIHFITRLTFIVVRTIKVLVFNPIKWLLKVILTLSMIIVTTIWRIIYFILRVFFSPFVWLWNKYVQAFGIPFYSSYQKGKSFGQKVKRKIKEISDWLKRDEKR
ncbi:spore cortex biosynthesis protein YabQ [Evansella tamaricis]|uniref:Spore cortex biosynthesis protein YabQ n=1 Tax=Evansella tamaricis TaxID=2069301 RepID=A0ABS6J903_9BACI|nr:spore cortex biosynthesis protein YabQ [Evansella tamaricis]